jgi:hypothetical protein
MAKRIVPSDTEDEEDPYTGQWSATKDDDFDTELAML